MPSSRITIVRADDYEAIYLNGELQLEGFVLSPEAVLKAVAIPTETVEADLDWFDEQSNVFPELLGDVQWRQRR